MSFINKLTQKVKKLGLSKRRDSEEVPPNDIESEETVQFDSKDAAELITITDISITDTGYFDIESGEPIKTEDAIVKPLTGECILFQAEFEIYTIVLQGDYIKVSYPSHTMPTSIAYSSWKPTDIIDEKGEVIATGVYDAAEHAVIYTFTDYVDQHTDITATLKLHAYINRAVIQENTKETFTFQIGNVKKTATFDIEYPPAVRNNTASVISYINQYDEDRHMIEQLIYVNPFKLKHITIANLDIINWPAKILYDKTGYRNILYFSGQTESEKAAQDNISIEVYKCNAEQLPSSMWIEDISIYEKIDAEIINVDALYKAAARRIPFFDIDDAYIVQVKTKLEDRGAFSDVVQSAVVSVEQEVYINDEKKTNLDQAVSSNYVEILKRHDDIIAKTGAYHWKLDHQEQQNIKPYANENAPTEMQERKVTVTLKDKNGKTIASITTDDKKIIDMQKTYNGRYALEFTEPIPQPEQSVDGYYEFIKPGKRLFKFTEDQVESDNQIEESQSIVGNINMHDDEQSKIMRVLIKSIEGAVLMETQTDAEGNFVFEVPPGDYIIEYVE